MAYHDDLLAQAWSLVRNAPLNQANLRRAVSSAYYAVFHMLIADATLNWGNVALRAALGRAFDHGLMKTASNRITNTRAFPFVGQDPQVVAGLRFVAATFVRLQEDRHFADYDLTEDLDPVDAVRQVEAAESLFTRWQAIRGCQIAQEYLVSLIVKNR